MDSQQEFQTTNIYRFEDEDDVFYSELREQVLQLTAEDDDEENKNFNMMVGRKEGLNDSLRLVSHDRGYYDWPRHKEATAAPAWIMNLWRSGNGTGVFIPQIVQSKKKNRSRRRSERGRTNKHVEKN